MTQLKQQVVKIDFSETISVIEEIYENRQCTCTWFIIIIIPRFSPHMYKFIFWNIFFLCIIVFNTFKMTADAFIVHFIWLIHLINVFDLYLSILDSDVVYPSHNWEDKCTKMIQFNYFVELQFNNFHTIILWILLTIVCN